MTHVDLQHGQTVRSLGPRRTATGLTPDFSATWAEVEPALRRFVASMGTSRTDVDDVVQEVAARAIQLDVPYRDVGDLRRWCFVVARHIRIDQIRLLARMSPIETLASTGDHAGSMRELGRVEDRHLLGTIRKAIGQLSARDRDVLYGRGSPADSNRRAVARYRARARLRRLVGPLAGVLPWINLRPRSRPRLTTIATAAPSLAVVVAASLGALAPAAGPVTAPPLLDRGASIHDAGTATARDVVATHFRRQQVIVRSVAPTRPSPPADLFRANAPAGAWATAGLKPNDGHQPLVCVDGTFVGRLCVDVPQLHHPISTNPPETAYARVVGS